MGRFLLWFVPKRSREEGLEAEPRASVVVAACLITGSIAALIAGLQLSLGIAEVGLAALVCAAFAFALPFALRQTGASRAIGALLCGAIWLAALAVSALTGGELVAALYYLVFAPALAAVLVGRRAALALGAASVAAIGALGVLHARGFSGLIAVEREVGIASGMRGALVFALAFGSLVFAYEWLRGEMRRASEADQQRFRALADHGVDVIVEVDANGRVVYTGRNPRSAIWESEGRGMLEGVHPEDRAEVLKGLRALAFRDSVRVGPLRWIGSSGTSYWFETAITRFQDGPRRGHVIAVARDITDQVELEQSLRQSQKLTAIGQLAGGAAHDFNNLLMVISGYAELLRDRLPAGSDEAAAVAEIQRASEHGADITRRLVALSRPTAIRRGPVAVNAVILDLEKILRRLLGESVRFELSLGRDLPRVRADTGELEQVLVNLVVNAREAMPQGGTLRIQTQASEDGVRILVADDGTGMDGATRERVFEPFFTTRAASGGTGLGLFVVDSIVGELGGRVRVDSERQRGTAIEISLPALEESRSEPAAPAPSAAAGGSERVLVVEDRAETRALMRAALEAAGYSVATAADGREALELVRRSRTFDLVVTDVVMPGLGGKELVRALRAQRPALRALFVSGHPQDLGNLDAIAPGARLLRKPFPLSELRRAAREVLDAG